MHNKKNFVTDMMHFGVVLFFGLTVSVLQVMPMPERFSARIIFETKCRIMHLNTPTVRAAAESALPQIIPVEKQRELLDDMCHAWLSDAYKGYVALSRHSPAIQDFILRWSKKSASVGEWKQIERQNHIRSMLSAGDEDAAMILLLYCRTQMAMLCCKCLSFGRNLLSTPMPPELFALTSRAIDESSSELLRAAAPVVASSMEYEQYLRYCRMIIESSKNFEVKQGLQNPWSTNIK